MVYYPVIIPTLNRVEHLKRCLSSLMKNKGAENTEVFLSVDYPPAEKYVSGYIKVKEYLTDGDFSCFKKFTVIYQDENLGPGGNSEFLKDLIKEKYDAFIYSEDDNEFAPNFLEYINKGLEIFSDNSDVIGICGSKDTAWESEGKNILFSKLYSAYGVGCWFHKDKEIAEKGNKLLLTPETYSPKKIYSLYKQNKCLFTFYISCILATDKGLFWLDEDSLNWCDSVRSIYMHFTDAVCVVPDISKSRTWGNDGSGVNMGTIDDYSPEKENPLDVTENFEYSDIDSLSFLQMNYDIGNSYLKIAKTQVIKAVIIYCLLFIFRNNRAFVVGLVNKLRSFLHRLKK